MFFRIPLDKDSLVDLGMHQENLGVRQENKDAKSFQNPNLESDPLNLSPNNEYTLLVWNVYKGKRSHFLRELRSYTQQLDFVLLQEVLHKNGESHLHCPTLNNFYWTMGVSFEYRIGGIRTGVANGSVFRSSKRHYIRSKKREAAFLTPKSVLLNEYANSFAEAKASPTARQTALLVVNCHSLNFTNLKAFVHQIEEIVGEIAQHDGPLIVAGDFNTWNQKRNLYLVDILKQLGLEMVAPSEDRRLLKLDHVFSRGVQIQSCQILEDSRGSDHKPILFKFKLFK